MSDYAIVKTGGKQYRVSPGDLIRVETLPGDEGDVVILDEVLMTSINGTATFGEPLIDNQKNKRPPRKKRNEATKESRFLKS